jgi:hypothetical protein
MILNKKQAFIFILLFITNLLSMAQTNLPQPCPLSGTWILKAAQVILKDGSRATDPAYGDSAKGILMIDADGQYSLQIFKPDRPKFSSGDKKHGTADEYASALLGMSTHVGHVRMDSAHALLFFDIDYAAYPNWNHTMQTRKFRLTGNELYYEVPPSAGAGTIAVSIWER